MVLSGTEHVRSQDLLFRHEAIVGNDNMQCQKTKVDLNAVV